MVNLLGYGTYIPKYRISIEDIASVWKKDAGEIVSGLHVMEKSVPGIDEDAVTVAFEAASQCVVLSGVASTDIQALFVGSESHPYAVNPTATIVGEFLGLTNSYYAADMEFACKAGTAGVQVVVGFVNSGQIHCGMAIGADTAQSKPHDVLEYTSACAGVAMMLGDAHGIAELLSFRSFTSDTPDFWRRDGIRYPSHAGRFTGEPAYFTHVMGVAQNQLKETNTKTSDYAYCVFHMPNGRFPREAARRLGFTDKQLAPSLVVDTVGNPYSASSMLGLSAVLDIAKPGETIFMVSYGSGAGSDAFVWKTTNKIVEFQKKRREIQASISQQNEAKKSINYVEYLKKTHKI
jgi:hydroxymethylglutaryl-CoA synthase